MLNKTKRYEDSAVYMTDIKGYVCVHCLTYYGTNEDGARRCCSNDIPCECGNRIIDRWSICKECRTKKNEERYNSKPLVTINKEYWNSGAPLCIYDSDTYYWNDEEVEELLEEYPDSRLSTCRAEPIPHFDIQNVIENYYVCCEDEVNISEDKIEELEDYVNNWMKENFTPIYVSNDDRIDMEDLKKQLGIEGHKEK